MSGSTTVPLADALPGLDRIVQFFKDMDEAANKAAEEMLRFQKKHEIQTERVEAQELEKGDIIVEFQTGKKPSQTKIIEIEHGACSSRGTHINKNWCYNARALVWVRI